jgi:hypothetical protein
MVELLRLGFYGLNELLFSGFQLPDSVENPSNEEKFLQVTNGVEILGFWNEAVGKPLIKLFDAQISSSFTLNNPSNLISVESLCNWQSEHGSASSSG